MGNFKSKLKRSKSKQRRTVKLPDSSSSRKTVDPRLPFSNYRQIFNIRNAWKSVSRVMDETAKENLIWFFQRYPKYKETFPGISNLNTEEEMRESMEFETHAMNIFGLFDDVVANLEDVDVALDEIHRAASPITKDLVTDMEETFMGMIQAVLDDRFTDVLEENLKLLYGFIRTEMHTPNGATG